jgi:hypothetical protein
MVVGIVPSLPEVATLLRQIGRISKPPGQPALATRLAIWTIGHRPDGRCAPDGNVVHFWHRHLEEKGVKSRTGDRAAPLQRPVARTARPDLSRPSGARTKLGTTGILSLLPVEPLRNRCRGAIGFGEVVFSPQPPPTCPRWWRSSRHPNPFQPFCCGSARVVQGGQPVGVTFCAPCRRDMRQGANRKGGKARTRPPPVERGRLRVQPPCAYSTCWNCSQRPAKSCTKLDPRPIRMPVTRYPTQGQGEDRLK